MAVNDRQRGIHGIRWPLSADGGGYYAPCKDEEEDIKQSLWHCLFVGPGEQFMHTEGLDLRNMVWEPVDDIFASVARMAIRNIIALKEPRIVVLDVGVARPEYGDGMTVVQFEIVYRRRGSRESKRLVTDVKYSR